MLNGVFINLVNVFYMSCKHGLKSDIMKLLKLIDSPLEYNLVDRDVKYVENKVQTLDSNLPLYSTNCLWYY